MHVRMTKPKGVFSAEIVFANIILMFYWATDLKIRILARYFCDQII